MNEKITTRHTARKAIVYVRQSSAYQVANNTESQRLQYAMQERLQELGWTEIEIIDDDLGRSAAGATARGLRATGRRSVHGRSRGRRGA